MFGIGNRHHTDQLPKPPYSLDVVADLHAGVYPDDIADALRARVFADPDSMTIWNALEATTSDLAAVPVESEPLPAYAQHKLDQALHAVAADHREPVETHTVTPFRRRRGPLLLSAVAAAAAVAAIAIATTFAFSDRSEPAIAAQKVPSTSIPAPSDVTLLSALGRSDSSAFGDLARRDRCLAANKILPTTPVLGTSSIQTGGRPAVVILLGTGKMGRFDALVVGADCDTANPSTLNRTTIGDK